MAMTAYHFNNYSNTLKTILTIMMMAIPAIVMMVMKTKMTTMMKRVNLGKERKKRGNLSEQKPLACLRPSSFTTVCTKHALGLFYYSHFRLESTRTKRHVLQNQWHVPILYILLCFNKPLIACYAPYIRGEILKGKTAQTIFG